MSTANRNDVFNQWCDINQRPVGKRKSLHMVRSRRDRQSAALLEIRKLLPSHYESPARTAARLRRLGYRLAADVLSRRLPLTKRARSGDLGEILATEYINCNTFFQIPIKRLRWKDGREQALRGDDLIGVRIKNQQLFLLKGEVKSARNITPSRITQARKGLNRNKGWPNAHTLAFLIDRLFEMDEQNLAIRLEAHLARQTVPIHRVTHLIFTLSSNDTESALEGALRACKHRAGQIAVALVVFDHKAFINAAFRRM